MRTLSRIVKPKDEKSRLSLSLSLSNWRESSKCTLKHENTKALEFSLFFRYIHIVHTRDRFRTHRMSGILQDVDEEKKEEERSRGMSRNT